MADSDKELVIRLKLDRTAADAAGRQFVQAEKGRNKELLDDVRVQEAAKLELVRRTNREKVQAAADAMQTEATATKRTLTEAQAAELAKRRLIEETNRARVAAISEAMRREQQATERQVAGFGAVRGAIGVAQQSLESMLISYAGLGAAVKGVNLVGEAWATVAENARRAALESVGFERQIRELAALQGKSTRQAAPELLQFSMQTGLEASQADEFQRQFFGSLPVGLSKGNIDDATAKELSVEAGKMAARQGGSAATRGDLAGILAQFGQVRSAEEGLGQLEAIRIGLTEGRGDDTPLTQALLHVAGSMVKEKGGQIASLPEMAALIGVTSLSAGPGMADTRSEQVMRGLRGTTPEQIKAISGFAGIKETDRLETRLDKIMPKLQEVGQEHDVATYLIENKLMNEENARAVVELSENYGVFKERMAKARGAQNGAAVREQNEAFLTKTGLGRNMRADAALQAARVGQGFKGQDYEAMFKSVEAERIAAGGDESTMTAMGDALEGLWHGRFSISEGRKFGIEEEVNRRLESQGADLGIKWSDWKGRLAKMGYAPEAPTLDQSARAWSELITEQGGDPFSSFRGNLIPSFVEQQARGSGESPEGGPGGAFGGANREQIDRIDRNIATQTAIMEREQQEKVRQAPETPPRPNLNARPGTPRR